MPTSNMNVDAYIDALEEPRKAALQQLRRIILETIQYDMPYYTYHGMLCAFAAQKRYLSFYLLNGEIVENNRHLLKGLSVGKGCIRFKDMGAFPKQHCALYCAKLLQQMRQAQMIIANRGHDNVSGCRRG